MSKEPIENIGIICNEHADERHEKWQQDNKNTVLRVGDYCKMGFVIKKGDPRKEHMWVMITNVIDKDTFKGRLDNDPMLADDLKFGDIVMFKRSDVSQHHTP